MLTPDEVLTALLDALRDEYSPGDPAALEKGLRLVAQPGITRTEDWCEGGCWMVYVRLDSQFPSTRSFPNPDAIPGGACDSFAARWHIGVARCVAGVTDGPNGIVPPDPDQQTADTRAILRDADRIRRAVRCLLQADPAFTSKNTHLGSWAPTLGGNCGGGYWPLTTRIR